jgi:hypothetical protein
LKLGHCGFEIRPLGVETGQYRIDKENRKRTLSRPFSQPEPPMPQNAVPNLQADADQREAATDQAIAACGGNAREAVRVLIVANEFLESEVCELMQAVSHAYARGRFKTYTG